MTILLPHSALNLTRYGRPRLAYAGRLAQTLDHTTPPDPFSRWTPPAKRTDK